MNHLTLPLDASNGSGAWGAAASAATRYGAEAMERLINDILKLGGRRDSLEVKLVGGGRVLGGVTSDFGARNIEFVCKYVANEGFTLAGQDLGGIYPREVQYLPETGKLRVKKLYAVRNHTLYERERHYLEVLRREPVGPWAMMSSCFNCMHGIQVQGFLADRGGVAPLQDAAEE